MTYKKRLYILLSLIAAMVLLLAGHIIFTSDMFSGQSSFVWIDARTAEKADKIVFNTPSGEIELSKRGNAWFVLHNETSYPARAARVQDLLSILSARAPWHVRSTGASAHERFGVLNEQAARITVYSDSIAVLDLLLGNDDGLKNETYFRRVGQNEVRSGESGIKTYLNSPVSSWYNLRLIPESEGGQIDLNSVQRLSVHTPSGVQIFARRNRGWEITGMELSNPDVPAIESYIRNVINIEGDGFNDSVSHNDPLFNDSRIELQIGTGRIITIRFGEPDDTGRRLANVSGSEYIYSIPSWAAGRLFRNAESFEM